MMKASAITDYHMQLIGIAGMPVQGDYEAGQGIAIYEAVTARHTYKCEGQMKTEDGVFSVTLKNTSTGFRNWKISALAWASGTVPQTDFVEPFCAND
jgi:hypothetical protein